MQTAKDIQWCQREVCPACSGGNWSKLFSFRQIHVYQCLECGLKFLNPCLNELSTAAIYQTSDSLKEVNPLLEHYYEESPEKIWAGITGRDFQKALEWLTSRVSGRNILDVASGNGIFLGYAKKQGWNPEGVDPSWKNAESVRKNYQVDVTVSGFLEYDKFEPKFDVITFWDFIEHPPKPSLYIQKVKNHLKPGGIFVLATPNIDNLLYHTAEALYRISSRNFSGPLAKMYTIEHACYFNLKTLTRLLEKNGFKVVHYFQTESHLERYTLPLYQKLGIKTFFYLNRLIGKQNRIVVFAERVS
ncbi:MAG: class I SAM-dependent methyltransferase [Candidatus Omnitrophica bacterium]|nr:class I SAM-dependent methyltransferase [Candidatus Omnitrophota bacterium]